jgi:predicted metal-binding membrane protein
LTVVLVLHIDPSVLARSIDGQWFARHPEWWELAISAGAWFVLAVSTQYAILPPLCTAPSSRPVAIWFLESQIWSQLAWSFLSSGLMMAAMMPPLVVLPVRHIAFRSFRYRRHRAIAEFLVGYLGVWILASAALSPIFIIVEAFGATGRPFIAAVIYSVAATWQLTPFKYGALQRCHRMVPVAPGGWRAVVDCIDFGVQSGRSCLTSCWALMAITLTSHGLGAMACVQAVMIRERYQRQPRSQTSSSLLLLSMALFLDWATWS